MVERHPIPFVATLFVALGYHLRESIHTLSDLVERRFAEFASVPYQNRLSRQQWEELWESVAER